MKLLNSRDLMIEDENPFEEEEWQHGPCWEVKVDRERNKVCFLLNGKERCACSMRGLNLQLEDVLKLLAIFKNTNDIHIVKEAVKALK